MKQPQYNKGDKVMFLFDGFNYALPGIIETVDASGTFFQKEQPYYDVISLEHGNALFKHIPEENIKGD